MENYGLELQITKKTEGKYGNTIEAHVYINGDFTGIYRNYGNGSIAFIDYASYRQEAAMARVLLAFGKEHPDPYILSVLNKDEEAYKNLLNHVINQFPQIPETDFSKESLSVFATGNANPEIIISNLLKQE